MRRMYSENQLENKIKEVKKDIATLVDKDGHDRFIEGDITLNASLPEGVEKKYAKWSLSGSHLMIVIAISIANATEITSGTVLCNLNTIPKWIRDKIVPIFGSVVNRETQYFYGEDYTTQNTTITMSKTTDLYMYFGALTTSQKREARIVVDLLIDND